MVNASTVVLFSLCITVATIGSATEEHLVCKKVNEIFTKGGTPAPTSRGAQGPPGKRGGPGPKGDRGLLGEPGRPGEIDLDRLRTIARNEVSKGTAPLRDGLSMANERILNELDERVSELDRKYASKFNTVKERLKIFMSRKEGAVMLANSDGALNYGRVEIYHNGEWGTVCDDNWDTNDASVICRMLNYTSATLAPGSARYGQGSGKIWLDGVNCVGTEDEVSDCPHNGWEEEDCGHSEDASVVCI